MQPPSCILLWYASQSLARPFRATLEQGMGKSGIKKMPPISCHRRNSPEVNLPRKARWRTILVEDWPWSKGVGLGIQTNALCSSLNPWGKDMLFFLFPSFNQKHQFVFQFELRNERFFGIGFFNSHHRNPWSNPLLSLHMLDHFRAKGARKSV